MAHSDKNILITPNIGSTTADPKIVFSGADATLGAQNITLQVYPTSNGTLSFEGSAGQLFSITNSMSGTIYSVNDVSGIPSIEVLDTGLVKLAQYSGNVLLGTGTDNATDKLQVNGSVSSTVLKSTVATGTAPLTVASTTVVTNLNADLVDGLQVHTGTNNEANKIVRTDASGYIQAGWINTTSGDNGTTAITRVYASSDGYIRYYSLSNFGSQLTNLNASNLASGTVPGDRGVTAGSASSSFVEYNGTTATAGQFDGGTTTPTGTTRLNYGGYFYPTYINLVGSADTATASSHYFVETGSDGFVRPKTLANVQAEIVSTAALGTGTASATTYLRGDRTWATVSAGISKPEAFFMSSF